MRIREKLFFMIFSVIILIGGGIYIISEFYLEKFYVESKIKSLKSISEIVINPKYIIDLDELEREENVTVYIKPLSAENLYEDLDDGFIEKFKRDGVMKKITSGEAVVERVRLQTYMGEYLILYKGYSEGSLLEIRTPISSIREAVSISSSYYMRLIAFVMVFGILLSLLFSKKITDPIIRLKEITKDIAELNFNKKFTEKRMDELGELGNSVNKMGDMLEGVIFELNRANDKLKEDIEHEKKLENLRKEFVASVSHELKTPIAIIQGYAQGLQEGIASEENRDFYCEVIVEESKKIDSLVKELLLISQIEAGYLQIQMNDINVGMMVRRIMDKYSYDFENYRVSYPERDIPAKGDSKYVGRVLENLIGNAFKYAKTNGRIEVDIEEKHDKVMVRVKNTCDNLAEEDLKEIWTPFYRGDKARSSEGTGLGLAIVKGILEKHGSEYGVRLEGDLVEFFFTLDTL